MPYNNTPIQPTTDITGQVSLPLARVKKIIAADDDISNCSNNAAFVITVAAEMFLQHLTQQTFNVVKSGAPSEGGRNSGKVRRNVQYRDVANAVSRVENLEFLADVVPKTTTYRTFKQKQGANAASSSTTIGAQQQPLSPVQQANGPEPARPTSSGMAQGTLDGHMATHPSVLLGGDGEAAQQPQTTNGVVSPMIEVPTLPARRDVVDDMDVDTVENDDTEGIEDDAGDDDGTESMHTAQDEMEGVGLGDGEGGGVRKMEDVER